MTILAITLGVLISGILMALSGALVYGLTYLVLVVLPRKEMENEEKDTDSKAATKD